jgi:hypothetical protein
MWVDGGPFVVRGSNFGRPVYFMATLLHACILLTDPSERDTWLHVGTGHKVSKMLALVFQEQGAHRKQLELESSVCVCICGVVRVCVRVCVCV